MAKQFYVGVIERGEDGTFGVFFPDLLGCVSAGDTLEEVVSNGREALAQHIESMIENGMPVPDASGPAAFDPDEWEGVNVHTLMNYPVDVPGKAAPSVPARRINVTMPDRLVARIDAAAQEHGFDRSGLLALAARQWLAQNVKQA